MSHVESERTAGQPRKQGGAVRSLLAPLLILAAFAAGIIVARSRFDDPQLTQNAWFRLGILVAAMVLLLGGIKTFRTRLALRLQVAVVVSLLMHCIVVLGLRGQQLWLARSDQLKDPQALEQGPDEKWLLPDYAFDATTPAPNDTSLMETDDSKPVDVAPLEPAVRIAPLSTPEIEPTASAPELADDLPDAPPPTSEFSEPAPATPTEPPPSATTSIDRQNPAATAAVEPPVESPPPLAAPANSSPGLAAEAAAPSERQSQPALPNPAEATNTPEFTVSATSAPPLDMDASLSLPPDEIGPLPDFGINQATPAAIARTEVELAPSVESSPALDEPSPQLATPSNPPTPQASPTESSANSINRVPTAVDTTKLPISPIPRNRPRVAAAEIVDPSPATTDQRFALEPVGDVVAGEGASAAKLSEARRQAPPPVDVGIPGEGLVEVPAVDANAISTTATPPSSVATTTRPRRAPPTIELDTAPRVPVTGNIAGPRIAATAPSPVDFDAGESTLSAAPAANSVASSNSVAAKLDRLIPVPSIDGRVGEAAPAFRGRRQRQESIKAGGGSPGSERAVELGLAFLNQLQLADGRWSLHDFGDPLNKAPNAQRGRIQADSAATGLALLTYLGAGYTHREGSYRATVDRGLKYLLAHQKRDGDLFTGGSPFAWLYSHGIATIVLCEAYGMTRDPLLREPAQRAINFIVGAQSRTLGGWRYVPRHESDTSVSGWQMMALKSGELAGLMVPDGAYSGLTRWLDVASSTSDTGTHYSYMPSSKLDHQRETTRAMTAEALLMRLYLGWQRDDPRVRLGVDFLEEGLPRYGQARDQARDAYYWYYGTQVMFQVGGESWETWNGALRDLLVANQTTNQVWAGSWDPSRPVVDRWGLQAGRLYVTAMHLLMLEVYYRHLPLYNTLTK